jgi:AraC family transcriptional regulator
MGYGTFETLRRQNAVLKGTVELNSGIQLAAWYNNCDTVTVRSDHHTLSLYVADGYESYQKTPHGWKNGGGPDRFCLMPKGDESVWDIRGDLSFVHLYCTDAHLRRVGEECGIAARRTSPCRKRPSPAMTKSPRCIVSFCWLMTGDSRRTS